MMTYRLQGCKKSAVIGWMAGILLLAGCTQDKPVDTSQGEMLPEGKYPMTFTVTGLEATATTRGAADGKWDGGEEVAVQVGDVVKKYVAVGSGESTTLQPADPDNAFTGKTRMTQNKSVRGISVKDTIMFRQRRRIRCGSGAYNQTKTATTAIRRATSFMPHRPPVALVARAHSLFLIKPPKW